MQGSKSVPSRIIATAAQIVPRRSTDFVAVADPDLAQALRYIRDHARSGLSAGQVPGTGGLSRDALNRKFRKLLGRSVQEEITRVRTEQIGRLLNETNLPVAEMAEAFGFPDAKDFLRSLENGKRGSGRSARNSPDGKTGETMDDGLPPWVSGVPI
jgi:LacI family transcriptional regulator